MIIFFCTTDDLATKVFNHITPFLSLFDLFLTLHVSDILCTVNTYVWITFCCNCYLNSDTFFYRDELQQEKQKQKHQQTNASNKITAQVRQLSIHHDITNQQTKGLKKKKTVLLALSGKLGTDITSPVAKSTSPWLLDTTFFACWTSVCNSMFVMLWIRGRQDVLC